MTPWKLESESPNQAQGEGLPQPHSWGCQEAAPHPLPGPGPPSVKEEWGETGSQGSSVSRRGHWVTARGPEQLGVPPVSTALPRGGCGGSARPPWSGDRCPAPARPPVPFPAQTLPAVGHVGGAGAGPRARGAACGAAHDAERRQPHLPAHPARRQRERQLRALGQAGLAGREGRAARGPAAAAGEGGAGGGGPGGLSPCPTPTPCIQLGPQARRGREGGGPPPRYEPLSSPSPRHSSCVFREPVPMRVHTGQHVGAGGGRQEASEARGGVQWGGRSRFPGAASPGSAAAHEEQVCSPARRLHQGRAAERAPRLLHEGGGALDHPAVQRARHPALQGQPGR